VIEIMKKTAWVIVVVGLLTALIFAQNSRNNSGTSVLNSPTGQALVQTLGLIQDQYLERLDQTRVNEVVQGGIKGMIEALDDQFTNYNPPAAAALRSQDLAGEFFGIGATLSPPQSGGGAQIVGLIRGLPAITAGLRVGDVIVEVSGEDVSKLTVNEVVAKVRGPKGTKVVIGVRREGSAAILRYEMIRERVEIVSVTRAMLPGNVGYVALETFGNVKVTDQLTAAIADLRSKGATRLVFDLRDNGGGLLDQGCQVASLFIKEGPVTYVRNRTETRQYCAASGKPVWTGPMAVLLNGNSASASEIVAGAIQDTDRAKVFGETSFGKGVGQNVIDLSNGGSLTLVTFEWLTPKRRGLNGKGVVPDVEITDSRFETPLSFEGAGVKPGETVTINVAGKSFTATANKEGKFNFSQPLPVRTLSNSEDRTVAEVDLEKDAILRKAWESLR
jgi:carboxyl-terminal processing protease